MNDLKTVKDYQIILFGLIVAIAVIFSTTIFTKSLIKYQKLQNQTITVTGSASQNVTSDFAVLNVSYKAQAVNLKDGYVKMNLSKEKIKNFFVQAGLKSEDIEYLSISNYEVNKKIGNFYTNEVDFYKFDSSMKVSSKDIKLIDEVARKLDSLVNEDVLIGYSNVEYYVSNLDDIKIKMVGEATKNAKQRAESMVNSTGDKIGSLNSAKMGVFQIVPLNSTAVSDYGISDTSSIEKKVVAVVNATFTVK